MGGAPAHEPTHNRYAQVAMTMVQLLSAIDPAATTAAADWHYWTKLFQNEESGAL
jgi:hypothetical protein